jgi:hypothetical protein
MRARVALILAAVAAIVLVGGSAFAASRWIITSTKQIKPSVLHQLQGSRGPQGPPGVQGIQGVQGPPGAPGNPAAYPTVLPSGHTEVGSYAVRWNAAGASAAEDAVVSFPLPLAMAPHVGCGGTCPGIGSDSAHCPGTVTAPTATVGTFCFYPGQSVNVGYLWTSDPEGNLGFMASLGGSVFVLSIGSGDTIARGTWAVTAP